MLGEILKFATDGRIVKLMQKYLSAVLSNATVVSTLIQI
jgi:hypothetical protein